MGDGPAGSIGALIVRLIESAKAFARAEIALAKCTALEWLGKARIALGLLAIVMVMVLAAFTVMLAALGMALAPWLGVAGGLAIAALIGLATAGILAFLAVRHLQGLGE